MDFCYQKIVTPVGVLYVVADTKNLRAVIFEKNWNIFKKKFENLYQKESKIISLTQKQLYEYFDGKRTTFSIPLLLEGTEFQRKVWKALEKIPFGETKSYKDQALLVKSPKAVRAVGRTNGLNPICIILPCHRVIGSDGSLTGYGGGMKVKKFLLRLEKADFKE